MGRQNHHLFRCRKKLYNRYREGERERGREGERER